MDTILITCIGKRVQLVRHFADAGYRVIGTDSNPAMAPASHFVHRVYPVPKVNDPAYIPTLLDIAAQEKIGFVIPLFEPELRPLCQHIDSFRNIGAEVIVSGDKALQICLDKYLLYSLFRDNGITTPDTFVPESLKPHDSHHKWVVKPRSGMGSRDVHILNNGQDALAVSRDVPSSIIQQYIDGTEYTIDAFVDRHGTTRSIVPRERLEVRAGEVSKSVTNRDAAIMEAAQAVLRLLPFYGPITIQGIKETRSGKFYFTEINPRFGGGVPLSIEAGVSYANLIRETGTKEKGLVPFRDGLLMLRYEEAVFVNGKQIHNLNQEKEGRE
ncbi:ATP-grasp domain-containing protein [uncultured Paenibacillus sp.]|uniref:ATP-grasp domain-containing protein n=1 Tax=uncultured Paenibacillus sp. TaxID=227322 RepID=UPI0028D20B0C|nr:ATP-grasp domain-containing protein [uncultured Paenibacillus sp.]